MDEINPEILEEFRVLTDEAAEYGRQSYGRSRDLPMREENRRAFRLLSRYLWLVADLVRRHPELRDEYREWMQLYPTFTSR